MRIPLIFAIALSCLLGCPRASAEAAPTRITSVEGINHYRLANGLEVLIAPDPSKPQIVVNITYLVGSRHENYGESGMAHLLEHMLFKGSKKHPKITDEFTQRGAQWNASTWNDRTNYYEVFTASAANLDWALSVEADRMVNSFIRKEDLASEMSVVRNEFEIGENDPTNILTERMLSTMFLWHNYGKSTIGARSDIENVSIPRLQAFYKQYYQPDNAVLVIAGRIDEAKALAMVAKHFGAIPKPSRRLQSLYTTEPAQDGERSVTLERVGDVQVVAAGFHVPPMAHADYALTVLLSDVLTNTPSGRLHKALVDTNNATSIAGYNFENRDPSSTLMWALMRKEHSLDDAKKLFVKTIEGFGLAPVTEGELLRAKSKLLKEIDLTINSSVNLAGRLSEAVGAGDWRLFFLHRDRLRAATVAQVQRAALNYLKPANRTIGIFVPTAKPDRTELATVADVGSLLKGYQGDPAIAIGEAFDATPDNIEKRLTRAVLAGGLQTAYLPKKTRGATVNVQLTLRFGDEANLKGKRATAEMVGAMLMRGTVGKTREQLRDAIDKLQADISVYGWANGASATISAKRETLAAAIKLASEMLRESNFDEKEFALVRDERLAAFERAASDPESRAREAMGLHFNVYPPGDVRREVSLQTAIAETRAVTLAEARRFHADFYGANHAEIAIVGDFDEAAITLQVAQLFGTWHSLNAYQRLLATYQAIPPVSRVIETPDKESATFLARINLRLSDNHSDRDNDYPAMKIADWMLAGGADFAARLVARIRVKEGLSYAVRSALDAHAFEPVGAWTVSAQYAPQGRARVEAAFRDEMAGLIKGGFLPAEFAAAKSGYAEVQKLNRASDEGLVQILARQLYYGRSFAWEAALDQKIAALNAAQITTVMQKYFDLANFTVVNAGDFAKSTPH